MKLVRQGGLAMALIGGILLLTVAAQAQNVVYVDATAVDGGDGLTWATAYRDLQDGLAHAATSGGTVDQIRVAAGTYKPTSGSDRKVTFRLINRVSLFGGFDGTESSLDERDLTANVTILSGDLGTVGDFSDNSADVVTGDGTDRTAVLDGFTITGGNADFTGGVSDRGGGIRATGGGSPTIRNCIVRGNRANVGAGMALGGGSTSLMVNCVFSGNISRYEGGAVFSGASSPEFINCSFSGNVSTDRKGGGINNFANSAVTVTNCVLWENRDRDGMGESAQIAVHSGSVTVNHSCIQGLTGNLGGTGNLGDEPVFVDADGDDDSAGTADDNLRLQESSPCIDTGDNSAVAASVTTDLDGKPRIVGTVDMGPYESSDVLGGSFVRGEVNGDTVVEIGDPLKILFFLFVGGFTLPCPDAADTDDDGSLDVTDGIYLLVYLFLRGSPPPPPFPNPGPDPTEDLLYCIEGPSTDSDGDGLSDAEEEAYGTDPDVADTDGDGVDDGDEENPNVDSDRDGTINARDTDSDNDGILDGDDSHPVDPDFDDDGIIDGIDSRPDSDDHDNDGLTNAEETIFGTDPESANSDQDGCTSVCGVKDGTEPLWNQDIDGDGLINALDPDSDDDGLLDREEDRNGNGMVDFGETSPILEDTDADGMPDGFEHTYGLDGTDPNDANDDADANDCAAQFGMHPSPGPSLTNLEEFVHGTDPTECDSDSDGLPDGWEVTYAPRLNPVDDANPDTNADPDADGLSNLRELEEGTSPNHPDTDGDGLGDLLEVEYPVAALLDPTDPSDAVDDPDGDGLTTFDEIATIPDLNGDGMLTTAEIEDEFGGTDPTKPDTDGDGIRDGFERGWNTDIDQDRRIGARDTDSDDDGLDDGLEDKDADGNVSRDGSGNLLETDPLSPDSDSDGIPDGTEWDGDDILAANETDPRKADTDDDGLNDSEEGPRVVFRTSATDLDPTDNIIDYIDPIHDDSWIAVEVDGELRGFGRLDGTTVGPDITSFSSRLKAPTHVGTSDILTPEGYPLFDMRFDEVPTDEADSFIHGKMFWRKTLPATSSYALIPANGGQVYIYDGKEYSLHGGPAGSGAPKTTPTSVALHSGEWRPGEDWCVLAGDDGTLFTYDEMDGPDPQFVAGVSGTTGGRAIRDVAFHPGHVDPQGIFVGDGNLLGWFRIQNQTPGSTVNGFTENPANWPGIANRPTGDLQVVSFRPGTNQALIGGKDAKLYLYEGLFTAGDSFTDLSGDVETFLSVDPDFTMDILGISWRPDGSEAVIVAVRRDLVPVPRACPSGRVFRYTPGSGTFETLSIPPPPGCSFLGTCPSFVPRDVAYRPDGESAYVVGAQGVFNNIAMSCSFTAVVALYNPPSTNLKVSHSGTFGRSDRSVHWTDVAWRGDSGEALIGGSNPLYRYVDDSVRIAIDVPGNPNPVYGLDRLFDSAQEASRAVLYSGQHPSFADQESVLDNGLNPNDHDTDGDGLEDGEEMVVLGLADPDGDGIIPALDDDSDNDCIIDGKDLLASCLDVDSTWDQDHDGDGLVNALDSDSDGDGFSDDAEAGCNGCFDGSPETDPLVDPLKIDTDGDFLSDGVEDASGTDKDSADSDGDGLPDGSDFSGQWFEDPDGDGLINALDIDSDNDGLPDGWIDGWGFDPVSGWGPNRTAADGVFQLGEGELLGGGTNPINPDTDGDGLRDPDELVFYLTDPRLPDSDSDGIFDGEELEQLWFYDVVRTSPELTDLHILVDFPGQYAVRDSADNDKFVGALTIGTYTSADLGITLADGDTLYRGLDPNDPDTDGDGLLDGEEVANSLTGTHPSNPVLADTDGDSYTDKEELEILHSSAVSFDTDGDGVTDPFDLDIRSSPVMEWRSGFPGGIQKAVHQYMMYTMKGWTDVSRPRWLGDDYHGTKGTRQSEFKYGSPQDEASRVRDMVSGGFTDTDFRIPRIINREDAIQWTGRDAAGADNPCFLGDDEDGDIDPGLGVERTCFRKTIGGNAFHPTKYEIVYKLFRFAFNVNVVNRNDADIRDSRDNPFYSSTMLLQVRPDRDQSLVMQFSFPDPQDDLTEIGSPQDFVLPGIRYWLYDSSFFDFRAPDFFASRTPTAQSIALAVQLPDGSYQVTLKIPRDRINRNFFGSPTMLLVTSPVWVEKQNNSTALFALDPAIASWGALARKIPRAAVRAYARNPADVDALETYISGLDVAALDSLQTADQLPVSMTTRVFRVPDDTDVCKNIDPADPDPAAVAECCGVNVLGPLVNYFNDPSLDAVVIIGRSDVEVSVVAEQAESVCGADLSAWSRKASTLPGTAATRIFNLVNRSIKDIITSSSQFELSFGLRFLVDGRFNGQRVYDTYSMQACRVDVVDGTGAGNGTLDLRIRETDRSLDGPGGFIAREDSLVTDRVYPDVTSLADLQNVGADQLLINELDIPVLEITDAFFARNEVGTMLFADAEESAVSWIETDGVDFVECVTDPIGCGPVLVTNQQVADALTVVKSTLIIYGAISDAARAAGRLSDAPRIPSSARRRGAAFVGRYLGLVAGAVTVGINLHLAAHESDDIRRQYYQEQATAAILDVTLDLLPVVGAAWDLAVVGIRLLGLPLNSLTAAVIASPGTATVFLVDYFFGVNEVPSSIAEEAYGSAADLFEAFVEIRLDNGELAIMLWPEG